MTVEQKERWDVFPMSEVEEVTQWTARAHERLLAAARSQLLRDHGFQVRYCGAVMRLRIAGVAPVPYVVEVRGQFSSHGLTGAHPELIAYARRIADPVQIVMVERGARICRAFFLDSIEEPPIRDIKIAPPGDSSRRQGWAIRNALTYALAPPVEGGATFPPYQFPTEIPGPREGVLL